MRPAWWFLSLGKVTLIDNEVVGLSFDIAFADASEEEPGDCVLTIGKVTSSPMIAMSLLPSLFLRAGFIVINGCELMMI